MARCFHMFCAALLMAAFAAGNAHAQAFGGDSDIAAPVVYAAPKFGENNPHLKKMLDLQYQMQLLRRMIEREKAVNQMLETALEIGARNPAIPKPERRLCTQIPANIACADAYDDLYPEFTKAMKDAMQSASFNSLPPIPEPSKQLQPIDPAHPDGMAVLPGIEALELADNATLTLFWTSVTCLNTQCSAIVTTDPGNPRSRYRIVSGETLPDGAVVEKISAAGVTLARQNKSVSLEPAPLQPVAKHNG